MLSFLPSSTIIFKDRWACGAIYACGQFGFGESSFYADDGFGNFIPTDVSSINISIDFESNRYNNNFH